MGDQENADEASVNNAMANVSLSATNNENTASAAAIENNVDNNDLSLDQTNSLVKIYVGSMPPDLDEDGLKSLLSDNSLPEPETVLVKRGYAFLEFTDQSKADVTISVVDGKKTKISYILSTRTAQTVMYFTIAQVPKNSLHSFCSAL